MRLLSITYVQLRKRNKDIEDVVATVLNRPRHQAIIEEIRKAGARIKLINDGDVAGAINTAFDRTGVDILFGSGGAPEGVLAAVALKCLGGEIHGNYYHKTKLNWRVAKDGHRRHQPHPSWRT